MSLSTSSSTLLASHLPWTTRMQVEIAHHAVLLILTLAYCLIALLYLSNRGIHELPVFAEYLVGGAMPLAALIGFRIFGETTFHAVHVRPFRPMGILKGLRQSEIFSPERTAAALIPVLLLPLFSSVFTTFKTSIPEIAPYSWDPIFMELDRTLHGGQQPWELLQPLLGYPILTGILGFLYNVWHGMILIVYWQMIRIRDRELRMQFLLSFVLAWAVLGSLFAFMFSSAGPCYYGNVVTGANPYADLMTYLYSAHDVLPNRSIYAQEYLWRLYEQGKAGLGGGISAMPSLHVSVALLIFLLMRNFGRTATWISGVYVIIILTSSVHLGWHYAIDGYVGLIGGWLAWRISGYLVRNIIPQAPPPPPTVAGLAHNQGQQVAP